VLRVAGSIRLLTLLAISFTVLPILISNNLTSIHIPLDSASIMDLNAREEQLGEEAYLRLVSDIIQLQDVKQ
jgi:hypothetical protein